MKGYITTGVDLAKQKDLSVIHTLKDGLNVPMNLYDYQLLHEQDKNKVKKLLSGVKKKNINL
jgi:hypothetical protein